MSLISEKYKNKEVCKYCKWSDTDQISDKYCVNKKSDNYKKLVNDFDSCKYFEKDE